MKPCFQNGSDLGASSLYASKGRCFPLNAAPPSAIGARLALATSALLASLGVSIANTALPAISSAFSATFAEARWVVVAYLLAVTVTVVLAGRLGDLLGRKNVFFGGIALFTLSSLLCAVAPSLGFLVAARVLQGIGGAATIALSQALVSESVPTSRIGGTMGLLGTTSAVGTAFGPSVGGFLITLAGWRSVFFLLFAVSTGAALLALRYLPESKRARQAASLDGRGALLLGGAVLLYSLGLSSGAGHSQVWGAIQLAAGAVMAVFFYFTELQAKAPLVQISTLQNRAVASSLTMNAIVSTVMMSTLIVGPFYLSQAMGLGLGKVGVVMSLGPCLSIVSGFPAGKLVEKLGTQKIASLGLGLMVLGALGVALLPSWFGLAGYVGAVSLLSPGYQLFLAANGTAVLTAVSSDQKGVVAGLLNLSRNLGLVTGASGMGAVYSAAMKAGEASGAAAASARGLQVTFLVAVALAFVALCLSLTKREQAS